MPKSVGKFAGKSFGDSNLRIVLLKTFNDGGALMRKKALYSLWFNSRSALRKKPEKQTALVVSEVRSHFYLQEQSQQECARTDLVRALDYRGLHGKADSRSERSQYPYRSTNHSLLASASSSTTDQIHSTSISSFGRNVSRPAQGNFCRNGS